jgi:predicted Zn-dependent protease
MSDDSDSDASNDAGAESEIRAAVGHARRTLASGACTQALALLLRLVAEAPPLGDVLELEVLTALQGAAAGRPSAHAAFLFRGVAAALPRSAAVAVVHGGRLHSDGEHLAALACFERALRIDPNHAAAQEGLENLRSFAAERWVKGGYSATAGGQRATIPYV